MLQKNAKKLKKIKKQKSSIAARKNEKDVFEKTPPKTTPEKNVLFFGVFFFIIFAKKLDKNFFKKVCLKKTKGRD